jgi:hypothetical protein
MMFDFIKQGFKRAAKLFEPIFQATGIKRPALNSMRLDSDEWAVKQKLGRSFFTRRITENTRHARLSSLTPQEYALAKSRGWVR